MHPLIKAELENLQLQFGEKSILTLDDYAALYNINRQSASRHLRRRGIPVSKEGRNLYISMTDLATYKAKCKAADNGQIIIPEAKDMKRRGGFSQQAERRQLYG
jgi:hypothetical protein